MDAVSGAMRRLSLRAVLYTQLRHSSVFPPPEKVSADKRNAFEREVPPERRFEVSFNVFYKQHGYPKDVLCEEYKKVKKRLDGNEILVKMMLAPVNPMDLHVIMGQYDQCPRTPFVAGNEGVGQVIEVGCNVKTLSEGSWVIPSNFAFGTWRSLVVCFEHEVIPIPNDVPLLGAATMSVAPCTAYRMLKCLVPLKPCDIIIQSAANSCVGQAVIQMCKIWGIHTINVVRDRQGVTELVHFLRSIGATHVITDTFLHSDSMYDFIRAVKKKPLLAIDCVGGKIANAMANHLACGGVIASYGQLSQNQTDFHKCGLNVRDIKVFGFWRNMWCCENRRGVRQESVIADLYTALRNNRFKPPPCEVMEIYNYMEAVRKATLPFKPKKIVLKLDDDLQVPPCEHCMPRP